MNGFKISGQVDLILEQVLKVNNASKEQQLGINQVNEAMIQMSESNRNNSMIAEETKTLAQSMIEQSTKLKSIGGNFEELILGRRASKELTLVSDSKEKETKSEKEESSTTEPEIHKDKEAPNRETMVEDLVNRQKEIIDPDDGSFNRKVG